MKALQFVLDKEIDDLIENYGLDFKVIFKGKDFLDTLYLDGLELKEDGKLHFTEGSMEGSLEILLEDEDIKIYKELIIITDADIYISIVDEFNKDIDVRGKGWVDLTGLDGRFLDIYVHITRDTLTDKSVDCMCIKGIY